MKKYLIILLTFILLGCTSKYEINLGNLSLKFQDMQVGTYLNDNTPEYRNIDNKEKVKKIIKLLEENYTEIPKEEALDSAPESGSLIVKMDSDYILLIKDNDYNGEYYYTFVCGKDYMDFKSKVDLVSEINEILK
ncbi:hypothetical protein [Peptoniphilus catoniae]|uniref:hypothetical protein n=1 Tax=Peptoniphilus catoniae TaxID=1660341 RepID=UPI0010FEDE59|nr:hypothetical protein [Peptoniphilus catoniae]